jgi:ATP-grasp domain
MTPSSTADLAQELTDRCAALVSGRKVILVGGVLAGATRRVRQLRDWGAEAVLVVADGVGTGELPTPDEASAAIVPNSDLATLSEEVASWISFASDPPSEAREAVDAFDPDGAALCLLSPFALVDRYLGRESLGGRPQSFFALEDKSLNDSLWDAAGVKRSPARVVEADPDRVGAAARDLDAGHGTVWSADASQGMNGGGDRVRWVINDDDAQTALTMLLPVSARIRVQPFLEGVPCSIHGFVLPDGVAIFRPVELVVLRSISPRRFIYAGISTCWDPSRHDRDEMREVARRVGQHLQREHGYRGGFSVDGVLTADGFLPTELNPRFAGGLSTIGKSVPELPLELVQMATIRGIDLGVGARALEELLVPAADAHRYGSAYNVISAPGPAETESVEVTGGPDGLRPAGLGDYVIGTVERGPANLGSLIRFTPAQMSPGMRMAPFAVAMFALADRLWSTAIGEVEAAPDVR